MTERIAIGIIVRMAVERSPITRVGSNLMFGALAGGGAGFVTGMVEMAIAGAVTADDPLLGAFALALYGGAFGLLFGTVTGLALAVIVSPFSARMVHRLRLAWGLCAAFIVFGLCVLAFGQPALAPGPNETAASVTSDLMWFYVAPILLAFVAGAAIVPLFVRDSDAPIRADEHS